MPKSVLIAAAKYIVLSTNYVDVAADIWKFFDAELNDGEDFSSWEHAKKLAKLFKANDKQAIKSRVDEKNAELESKLEQTMPAKSINSLDALIKRNDYKFDAATKIFKTASTFKNMRETFCFKIKSCLQALDWYESYNLWYAKLQGENGQTKLLSLFVTNDKVGFEQTTNSKLLSIDCCNLEEV